MKNVYSMAAEFKKKYPMTIAWRLKAHSSIIERHLNPSEEVSYAFACQKNYSSKEIFSTYVVALTNERLLIAQKRVLFGYLLVSITPDLYNDLTVEMGIMWGKILIDTIKETVQLSNIDKNALPEIETNITEFMINAKQRYGMRNNINDRTVNNY